MKMSIRKYLPIMALLLAIGLGGVSCKSKKKVSELSDPKKETTETSEEKTAATEEEKTSKDKTTGDTKKGPVDFKEETKQKLANYFNAIANAPSTASANRSINEALNLFESPDALVLLIISETNGKKDYDEPTTIEKYLNYLKDTGKSGHKIAYIAFNDSGDITELELK
ncbi:MAG: nucleoid-structuring protein H-NS [Fulvivirga sp.]|nr:nucleoid-structuring protein H-NS [Fulvivirga sp.]